VVDPFETDLEVSVPRWKTEIPKIRYARTQNIIKLCNHGRPSPTDPPTYYQRIYWNPAGEPTRARMAHDVIAETFMRKAAAEPDEIVDCHHVSKRRDENHLLNLEFLTKIEHQALHAAERHGV
jgi:hypothetical protein